VFRTPQRRLPKPKPVEFHLPVDSGRVTWWYRITRPRRRSVIRGLCHPKPAGALDPRTGHRPKTCLDDLVICYTQQDCHHRPNLTAWRWTMQGADDHGVIQERQYTGFTRQSYLLTTLPYGRSCQDATRSRPRGPSRDDNRSRMIYQDPNPPSLRAMTQVTVQ
jgi:hypothetical protein